MKINKLQFYFSPLPSDVALRAFSNRIIQPPDVALMGALMSFQAFSGLFCSSINQIKLAPLVNLGWQSMLSNLGIWLLLAKKEAKLLNKERGQNS